MQSEVLQTWITHQGPSIVMFCLLSLGAAILVWPLTQSREVQAQIGHVI